ncbi:MAG: epoxyqueuosine reductase QueH [Erysipelotrichia bacterium]|nr:epoxyqueuosine reductase QueH [Erysipelotrichia bacterium]
MNKEDVARCISLRQKAYHTNYYLESLKTVKEIKEKYPDHKPRLLLHACCAVCASWPLEFLSSIFDITVYFNNSNIYPKAEYTRRLSELKRYLSEIDPDQSIQLIVTPYDNDAYTAKLAPMKDDPEGFGRCFYCYALRMNQAYAYASEHCFDYFTTVMSISRQKDSQKMNEIGRSLSRKYPAVAYFYSDFKKANGQQRKDDLSKIHHLYRQDYCGCIYSWQSGHQKKK